MMTDETSLALYDEPLTRADIATCLIPIVGQLWTAYKMHKGEGATPRFRRRVALNTVATVALLGFGWTSAGLASVALGVAMVVLLPSKPKSSTSQ